MPNFWGCRCCGGGPCSLADCEFSSETMSNSDFVTDAIVCSYGTPADISITNTHEVTGGNPTESRKIIFEQSGTATENTKAYAFLLLSTLAWDSTEQGDISSITECIEAVNSTSSNVSRIKIYAAIRQGTDLFIIDSQIGNSIGTIWKGHKKIFSYGASIFRRLDEADLFPTFTGVDTSVGADPVEVGLAVCAVIQTGDADKYAEVNLDNFCLKFTADFPCVCSKASEFQVDVSGITGTPGLPWYESGGSYILQYFSEASGSCLWQFSTPGPITDYVVRLLVFKTDSPSDSNYREVIVSFEYGAVTCAYWNGSPVDTDEWFTCGKELTLVKNGTGIYPGNFPSTITLNMV